MEIFLNTPSPEAIINFYVTTATETSVSQICSSCNQPFIARATIFIHKSNPKGKLLGYSAFTELLPAATRCSNCSNCASD